MQCHVTEDVFVGNVQRCKAVKRKSRKYQVNNKKRATGTSGADDVSGLQDPTGTKEPLMELGPEPADSIVDSTKTKRFGTELSKAKSSRKERESTVNRSTYPDLIPDCDDDVYSGIVDTSGCHASGCDDPGCDTSGCHASGCDDPGCDTSGCHASECDDSGCDDSQSLSRQEPEDSQMELLPEPFAAPYPVLEIQGIPMSPESVILGIKKHIIFFCGP